jgi:Family of unknown function (DUF6573)
MADTVGKWETLSVYTRDQVIEDGTLVAVAEGIAREAGFTKPVALTRAVFEDCVAWTDRDTEETGFFGQSTEGRLWDVLGMARLAAGTATGGDRVAFQVLRLPRDKGRIPIDDLGEDELEALRLVSLVLVCGPGDQGEPVLTIQEPGED